MERRRQGVTVTEREIQTERQGHVRTARQEHRGNALGKGFARKQQRKKVEVKKQEEGRGKKETEVEICTRMQETPN